jgi:hypothetical protein
MSMLLARSHEPDQRATPAGNLSSMGAVVDDQVHRLNVAEYEHLVARAEAAGEFGWDRTELVEGVVYDVSPESSLHASAVHDLLDALRAAFPDQTVRITGSIRFDDESLWKPDVYVLAPGTNLDCDYPPGTDVELAVEVSLTSLGRDLGPKYRRYSAAGIAQYWVLLPQPGGYLLRHRDPTGHSYATVDRVELPDGYTKLDVASLLDRPTD